MKKALAVILGLLLMFSSISLAYDLSTKDINTIKTFIATVVIKSLDNESFPDKIQPKLKKLISTTKKPRTQALATEIYIDLGCTYGRDGWEYYLSGDYQKKINSLTGTYIDMYSFGDEIVDISIYYNSKGEYPKSDYLISMRNLLGKGKKETYYKQIGNDEYILAHDISSGYDDKIAVLQAFDIRELDTMIGSKTPSEISKLLVSGSKVDDSMPKYLIYMDDDDFRKINDFDNSNITSQDEIYMDIIKERGTILNFMGDEGDMMLFESMLQKMGAVDKFKKRMIEAQMKARDTEKKGALRNLSTALLSYYNDLGKYPKSTTFTKVSNLEETLVPEYIENIPWNPSASEDYYYMSLGETGFVLVAQMEMTGDCNFGAKDIDDLQTKIKNMSKDDLVNMLESKEVSDESQGCFYLVIN